MPRWSWRPRAGEKWAQEALFRRYSRMVNGLAFRLLGRDQDVDDLVQDSFVSALRSLDRLAAAAGVRLLARFDRGAQRPQAAAPAKTADPARAAPASARRARSSDVAPAPPPSVAAELRSVYGCLDELETEARIALVLHRVDGLSIPEVAAQMQLSVSTVKRRFKVAERHLAVHTAGDREP